MTGRPTRSRSAAPSAVPRADHADHAGEPGWRLRLEARFGLLEPIHVLVFRSFGTPDALHLRGRVVERRGVSGTTGKSSTWRNILDTLRRLESTEIPGARLRATVRGRQWETVTDQEGYFAFQLDLDEPLDAGWHEVEIELVESVGEPERRVVREQVLVPRADAEFAVVSDLDDTVIETHSTELLEQIAILFGNDARERVVIPGIPAFYRALARGGDDRGENPIFYVSRSGWNLYDLFEEFLDVNDVPPGPLFLRDLRLVEDPSPVMGRDRNKRDSIELLLRTYPDLPFILIGDSGMHDPELYADLAERHPGRIRAIYIHDVSGTRRDVEVGMLATRLATRGVPLVRMERVLQAAEHAAGQGFISRAALAEVRRETAGGEVPQREERPRIRRRRDERPRIKSRRGR